MLLLAVLIVGAAVAGVAYATGQFNNDADPDAPLVVIPTPTAEPDERPAEQPTIEAVATATDIPTLTVPIDTPTAAVDEDPAIIVSEVPESTPDSEIQNVDEVDIDQ